MYFSNITNSELTPFHQTVGADFNISLSEILHQTSNTYDNKLFKIENHGNNIYRIYPLFYCKKVVSSNADDKVSNPRCLIVIKDNSKETYINFTTDTEASTLINESIFNIKSINDTLTTNEFNDFVYCLRQVGSLTGNINYRESSNITGVYGTYIFNNLSEQLRNNTGIIINDQIKNNPITVKLTNPFFKSAKYTLTCTVVSLTGANVCDENSGEYIVKDTFTVDLIKGIPVPVDVSSYTNDSVLIFDVGVAISFDVPEIVNSDFSLELSSDEDYIEINGDITLTATLSSEDESVSGYNINFYEDNVWIGSETTGNDGVATLSDYTVTAQGIHTYKASVIGLNSECTVQCGKNDVTITCNIPATLYTHEEFTVSGIIKDSATNTPLANTTLTLQLLNYSSTVTTDANGAYTKDITLNDTFSGWLYVKYDGDTSYYSKTLTQSIKTKRKTKLTISTDKSTIKVNESVTITGEIKDYHTDTGIINIDKVHLLENGVRVMSVKPHLQEYSFTRQVTSNGTKNYKIVFDGDSFNVASESSVASVTCVNTNVSLLPVKQLYDDGDIIDINVLDENNNLLQINEDNLKIYYHDTTESVEEGVIEYLDENTIIYTIDLPSWAVYAYDVVYLGDSTHDSSKATILLSGE